jgi:hypothetical protein
VSFFLIRLLQRFVRFELAEDAQPVESRAPAEWAKCKGIQGTEKIWPRSDVMMYVKVRYFVSHSFVIHSKLPIAGRTMDTNGGGMQRLGLMSEPVLFYYHTVYTPIEPSYYGKCALPLLTLNVERDAWHMTTVSYHVIHSLSNSGSDTGLCS